MDFNCQGGQTIFSARFQSIFAGEIADRILQENGVFLVPDVLARQSRKQTVTCLQLFAIFAVWLNIAPLPLPPLVSTFSVLPSWYNDKHPARQIWSDTRRSCNDNGYCRA